MTEPTTEQVFRRGAMAGLVCLFTMALASCGIGRDEYGVEDRALQVSEGEEFSLERIFTAPPGHTDSDSDRDGPVLHTWTVTVR